MKLEEYLNIENLNKHVAQGFVTARRHNTLPLTIYSYSRKTVLKSHWNYITRRTRGLIVADDGEIIARPYEKFFSYNDPQAIETHPATVRDIDANFGPPVITEKINGCLGIFWKYGVHWGVATKGSFHSPHAEWATKWLEDHIEHNGKLVFPEGYTPVFEIICQDIQPHVIHYEHDGLVLLNFIKIETGEELSQYQTAMYASTNKLAIPFVMDVPLDEALTLDKACYEGLVATYNAPGQPPYKLKIKFPTFLKNRKIFYEQQKLLRAESPEQSGRYKEILDKAIGLVYKALVLYTLRSEIAEFFNTPENQYYAPVCFALLDSKDYKPIIKSMLEKEKSIVTQ